MGTEVSISGVNRSGRAGGIQQYPGVLWSAELSDCRAERPGRECSLVGRVPPKISISKLMGVVKGRTALRLFTKFSYLRKKSYWGNHFSAKGYCVDTVGVDAGMIRKYVKYQQKQEQRQQEMNFRK